MRKAVLTLAGCLLLTLPAAAQTFRLNLSGERVVGAAGDPDGTGVAVVTIDGGALHYYLWLKSVEQPAGAQLRAARAGASGALVADLAATFQSAASGVAVASGTVPLDVPTSASLVQDPGAFAVEVTSGAFPAGALRGQLLGSGPSAQALAASLLGTREVPAPGDPDGSGVAALVFDGPTVYYYLRVGSLGAPSAATVSRGPRGANGPVVVDLKPTFSGAIAQGSVAADPVAATAIWSQPEDYYVNLANAEFPTGAVRGQLEPTETVLHVPVVARNAGAGASYYKTDLRIQTLADEDTTVWVEWYPTSAAGSTGPASVVPVAIAAGGEAVLDDVVDTLFAAATRGALRLSSTAPVRAAANVYNDRRSAGSGTFGQFEEGLDIEHAYQAGTLLLGSHRPKADGLDHRANLGYFNPRPTAVDVTFNVRRPDGTLVASQTVTFPGWSNDIRPYHDVVSDVPAEARTQPAFYITYAADGPIFLFLSVVDNVTDDGLHQPAAPAPAGLTVGRAAAANQPPDGVIVSPAGDVGITAGQAVSFAGSASDPDGDPVTVMWSFGDGGSSASLSPGSHSYAAAGTYTATFTATDSRGLADPTPDRRTITVTAPSVTLTTLQSTVFTPACSGCHGRNGDAGMDLRAGQSYSNLVNVRATSQSGTRVIPGDPSNSVLVKKLASGHRSRPTAEQQQIRNWILAGAQNN